jgi:hypothetical protein
MDTAAIRMFESSRHCMWHRVPVRLRTSELFELFVWLEREAGEKWAYHIQKRDRYVFFIKDPVVAFKFQAKHGF